MLGNLTLGQPDVPIVGPIYRPPQETEITDISPVAHTEGNESVESVLIPKKNEQIIAEPLAKKVEDLNAKLAASANIKKASLGLGVGMFALKIVNMFTGGKG